MNKTKQVRRSNGDRVQVIRHKGHTITLDRRGNVLGVKPRV